jgi:hypothetical protein
MNVSENVLSNKYNSSNNNNSANNNNNTVPKFIPKNILKYPHVFQKKKFPHKQANMSRNLEMPI